MSSWHVQGQRLTLCLVIKPGTKAANTLKKKLIRSTVFPQLHFQQEAVNCCNAYKW